MTYADALEKFGAFEMVCIVVKTKDGLRALTKYNYKGGVCGHCDECECNGNLIVERIIDLDEMEVLYQADK